jgi:RNA recognition motif-containing protein
VLPYTLKFAKMQSKSGATSADSSSEKNAYVFVKGFSKERWGHEDLYKAFLPFGTILSAKVSIDRSHHSKGFGYVQFQTED